MASSGPNFAVHIALSTAGWEAGAARTITSTKGMEQAMSRLHSAQALSQRQMASVAATMAGLVGGQRNVERALEQSAAAARDNTQVGSAALRVERELTKELQEKLRVLKLSKAEQAAENRAREIASALARAQVSADSQLGKGIIAQVTARQRLKQAIEAETAAQDRAAKAAKTLATNTAAVARESVQAEKGMSRLASVARGLVAALGLTVSAAGILSFARHVVTESALAQDAMAKLQNIVTVTGQKAGISAKQLSGLAGSIQDVTRFGDEAVMEAEATLLRFGRIQGDVYKRALQTIVDVAAGTGKDLQTVALSIGKSLEIPGEALRSLAQLGVVMSDSQQKALDKLVATGQGVKAQAELLSLLEARYKGAAVAAAGTLGGALDQLKNFVGELYERVGEGGLSGAIQELAVRLRDAAKDPAVIQMFRDLGAALGEFVTTGAKLAADVLPVVTSGIKFLAENMDLLAAAVALWLGYQVWVWLGTTAAGTHLLAIANAELLPTIWGMSPAYLAAKNAAAAAQVSFRASLSSIGPLVIVALLALNELIKKWGEASAAATQFEIDLANAQGRALAFSRQVGQGALYGTVTKADFDARLADAEKLKDAIVATATELENLKKQEAAGPRFLESNNSTRMKELRAEIAAKEQAVANQMKLYGQLRTALAEVTVAEEKIEENGDPFAGMTTGGEKARDVMAEALIELQRWTAANELLRKGMPEKEIQALVAAAEQLGTGNLYAPAVVALGKVIGEVNRLQAAFELANQARAKLTEAAGNFDAVMSRMFAEDPTLKALVADLAKARDLTAATATEEERRVAAVAEAQKLYDQNLISADTLQRVVLANTDQWNVELTESQKRWQAIAAEIADVADGIARDLAGAIIQAWREGEDVTDAALDTMKDAFARTLEDILSSWLAEWFRAMAAWLQRWIATQAAARAASASLGSNSGAPTGVTWGMPASGATTGATTGTGTAGMSGLAAMGVTLAVFAVIYLGVSAWIKGHRKIMASATATIDDGKVAVNQMAGNSKTVQGVIDGLRAAVQQAVSFIRGLGAAVTSMEKEITLARKGQGKKTNWTVVVGGMVKSFGKDVEAALEYAAIQAARQSVYTGLDPITEAAIKRSVQEKWDAFQKDIGLAQRVAMMGKPQSAQAQAVVHQEVDFLIAEMVRILGPSKELADAIGNITANMAVQLQAQRDQLTGHQRTAAEELAMKLAEAHAWNAELALRKANVAMSIIQAKAAIAAYEATRHAVGGGGGKGGPGSGGPGGGILGFAGAMLYVAGAASVAAASMLGGTDETLAAMYAQLAALEQLAATLDTIKPIDDSEVKGGKGGRGGGRGQARQDFRDTLAEIRKSFTSEFEQSLTDVQDKYKDLLAEAKRLKMSEAEVMELRERAIEELAQSLRDQVAQYLSPDEIQGGTFGLSGWDKQAAEISKSFADLRAANAKLLQEEKKRALTEVQLREAETRAMRALAEQVIDSFGLPLEQVRDKVQQAAEGMLFLNEQLMHNIISGERYKEVLQQIQAQTQVELLGIAASILDQMGQTEEAAKVKAALEEANFRMQVLQLNTLYQGYLMASLIGQDAIAEWERLLGIINDPANWPNFTPGAGNGPAPGGGYYPDPSQPKGSPGGETWQELAKEIADQIREWKDIGIGPLTKDARDMAARFADLTARAKKLNLATADLSAAYAGAVRAFIDDALKPFEDAGKSQIESALADIAERFADMKAAFDAVGATAADYQRLEEARLKAIVAAWDQALQSVRDLRRELRQGDLSILDGTQKFDELMAEFFDLQARFAAGDLTTLDEVDRLRDLLAAARDMIPVGSVAYDELFLQVDKFLQDMLDAQPDGGGGAAGSESPPWALSLNSGVTDLTTEVAAGNAEQYNELRLIRLASQQTAVTLAAIKAGMNSGGVMGTVN